MHVDTSGLLSSGYLYSFTTSLQQQQQQRWREQQQFTHNGQAAIKPTATCTDEASHADTIQHAAAVVADAATINVCYRLSMSRRNTLLLLLLIGHSRVFKEGVLLKHKANLPARPAAVLTVIIVNLCVQAVGPAGTCCSGGCKQLCAWRGVGEHKTAPHCGDKADTQASLTAMLAGLNHHHNSNHPTCCAGGITSPHRSTLPFA